jgi:hypothetical protein
MNRQPKQSALIRRHILISLISTSAVLVACYHRESSGNNLASPQSNQTVNPKVGEATALNNENKNQTRKDEGANIQVTLIPPLGAGPDRMEKIAGTASGIRISDCKVVIFSHTDKWYVQPYIDSSDTSIGDDGAWENDTHLGSEYAALLVKSSYKPPSSTGTLPNATGPVLAVVKVAAKK